MDYSFLDPLKANPGRSGVLSDLDGTLSPIAPTPGEARVGGEARRHLRLLNSSYGLVAVVSGRPASEAMGLVGIGELVYSGNHGLELLSGGETRTYNDARYFREGIREVLEAVSKFRFQGVTIEDKGIGRFAVHYRNSCEPGIREQIEHLLERATCHTGLVVKEGRMVFEVRPPLTVDKGEAVSGLCRGYGLEGAVYLGDDLTDIDAFRGIRESGMDTGICIAVDSPESPEGLKESADIVLPSQEDVMGVLGYLASGSD